MPLMRTTRLNWPRWGAAMAFLVLGPLLLVGPYVAIKGGLGTKPAVARLLGTAPKSAALAVERERPLDPDQSTAKTYILAVRAMAQAVRTAVTLPLLPLAVVGLISIWPPGPRARPWLFMTIVMVAAALALVRLHATGGYCSPRHAMVIALPLIGAAAAGLSRLLTSLAIPGRFLGLGEGRFRAGPAVWMAVLAGFVAINSGELFAPINAGWGGYRAASDWLAKQVNVPPDERIVDVTGWTLFYGQRPGYTFANLVEAPAQPRPPLGRRPRGAPARALGLLQADPIPGRRPPARGVVPRESRAPAGRGLYLRPEGGTDPGRVEAAPLEAALTTRRWEASGR